MLEKLAMNGMGPLNGDNIAHIFTQGFSYTFRRGEWANSLGISGGLSQCVEWHWMAKFRKVQCMTKIVELPWLRSAWWLAHGKFFEPHERVLELRSTAVLDKSFECVTFFSWIINCFSRKWLFFFFAYILIKWKFLFVENEHHAHASSKPLHHVRNCE